MEFQGSVFCRTFYLYVTTLYFMQSGQATEIQSRSNPCVAYSICTNPITIPVTRVITALYSFNFFRLADGELLSDVCQELDELETCQNFLRRCRDEGWPQAVYFQNSDAELVQWVCRNKSRFEAATDCWDDPFLAEMSSCTGLEQLLQPRECLVRKIQDLDNCSEQSKQLFQDLLSAAHSI